jgi:hypothetical protein
MSRSVGTPRLLASLLPWALAAAAFGIGIGAAVRFLLIEPAELGWACQVTAPPAWCVWRSGLIVTLQWGALGGIAFMTALIAVLGGGRRVCLAAACTGAAALFLYGAGAGAAALVLALLRALRLSA